MRDKLFKFLQDLEHLVPPNYNSHHAIIARGNELILQVREAGESHIFVFDSDEDFDDVHVIAEYINNYFKGKTNGVSTTPFI